MYTKISEHSLSYIFCVVFPKKGLPSSRLLFVDGKISTKISPHNVLRGEIWELRLLNSVENIVSALC